MDQLKSSVIETMVRIFAVLYACALLVFTYGLCAQSAWATRFWPLPMTTPLSYKLVASFLAAAAAAIFWAAITRDWGAFVGIGLDSMTIGGGAAYFLLRSDLADVHPLGYSFLGLVLGGLIVVVLCWNCKLRIQTPTPLFVRISFVVFLLLLLTLGGRMMAGNVKIVPWKTVPPGTMVYGSMYFGAAVYFIYGLYRPKWSNAIGQLLSFLAYDLVLYYPFILHFKKVPDDLRINLIVYMGVLVFSSAVAIWYCFISKKTRIY